MKIDDFSLKNHYIWMFFAIFDFLCFNRGFGDEAPTRKWSGITQGIISTGQNSRLVVGFWSKKQATWVIRKSIDLQAFSMKNHRSSIEYLRLLF